MPTLRRRNDPATTPNPDSKRVLLIRNISIMKAITAFRQARIQNKYIESDHVDITDVGIKQACIESEVKYYGRRCEEILQRQEAMEKKLDLLMERLGVWSFDTQPKPDLKDE